LSKIIEKIIKHRLTKFLDSSNILSQNQFGFRERLGTSDAISKLSQTVINSLDQNKYCIGVFLDLAKAFDTVCHRLLLAKLNNIGIVGTALNWFRSYLSGRTQVVNINNVSSSVAGIEYGVPQGSVLGPILFNIFINDFCDLKINGCITTFADDTVILFSGDSWSSVNKLCETEMRTIKLWLDSNLLSLNVDKTKFMTFSLTETGQPANLTEIKIHSCDPTVLSCNCK
jgi:retron-type reverse transcriptase